MNNRKERLKTYASSLCVLAVAICLCPAVAGAQPPDVVSSDGNANTAAGTDALLNMNGAAGGNTAFGAETLVSSTTGSFNTAIGARALSASTGAFNTATGAFALYSNTTGGDNTATGSQALVSNTTGQNNTANGADALKYNTTGQNNTANGVNALADNLTGQSNTASGYSALARNYTGTFNTASGVQALNKNIGGQYNTATGGNALASNTDGYYNTAEGYGAMLKNTTGDYNTAIGDNALHANTTGNNNVALGYSALDALATGANNIALGTNAGKSITSGSNNIYIGNLGATTESGVTRIGTKQRAAFIAGIAQTPLSGASVVINAAGQLGVIKSSARYKSDIKPLDDMAGKLTQLRPVSYRYKSEPKAIHYGLIAEQVDKVMPELVVRDEKNKPDSVQYQELIPLLLQQWKAQQAEIARESALVARQEERIGHQDAELAELRQELRQALATRLAGLDKSTVGTGH